MRYNRTPEPLEQRVVIVRVEAHPKDPQRCIATTAGGSRANMTIASLGRLYRLADDCELPTEWMTGR